MKYSFASVAADPDKAVPAGSVEAHFQAALKSRKPDVAQKYRDKATALTGGTAATRAKEFGPYGQQDAAAYRATGFAKALAGAAPKPDRSTLEASLKAGLERRRLLVKQAEATAHSAAKPAMLNLPRIKAVRLRFDRLHCVDETDGEWPGSDEILLGGMAVDEHGNTTVIKPFLVRPDNQPKDGFDDNDKKHWADPGRAFASFSVPGSGDWPRYYTAIVVMAEEDFGGFQTGLYSAWAIAAPTIKKEVEKYVGDFAAEYVGEAFGEIIGKVVAWVVGAFVGWIIGMFADDVFKPGYTIAGLHTRFAAGYIKSNGWNDYRAPSGRFTWVGHGGKYTLDCHWQVDPA
ncbi:MAG: hypothetical protein ACRDT6_25875 [Micromonosporaceae bacterium]